MNRIHLETVDSTSNFARRLLDRKELMDDFILIDADDQTAGRGQRGNSWETEAGKNAIFSLICHPVWLRPAQQYVLSEAISLAVVKVLKGFLSADEVQKLSVKWPNDIYYADKKVSGTLIECDLMGAAISNCIVGTGVNVNQQRFISDAPNPVSLYQIVGKDMDREQILLNIVNEFLLLYEDIKNGNIAKIHEHYKASLYRSDGRLYPFSDKKGYFNARIVDIEPSGRMILETESGELRRYEFKEVKFILPSKA